MTGTEKTFAPQNIPGRRFDYRMPLRPVRLWSTAHNQVSQARWRAGLAIVLRRRNSCSTNSGRSARGEWHFGYPFRGGLATNLRRRGLLDKMIQVILRHSNVAVTPGLLHHDRLCGAPFLVTRRLAPYSPPLYVKKRRFPATASSGRLGPSSLPRRDRENLHPTDARISITRKHL